MPVAAAGSERWSEELALNIVKTMLRRIDAFQQRVTPLAVLYGVLKKSGDDNAGLLITNVTYSGFVTIFPLLLLLVTILGLVFSSDPSVRHTILNSALAQFPLIGSELGKNSTLFTKQPDRPLRRHRRPHLRIARACRKLYVCHAAGLERAGDEAPKFLKRTGRSLAFLVMLGVALAATTFLTGVGFFGLKQSGLVEVGAIAISLLVNCGLYLAGFRILTPKEIPTGALAPGAALGGLGWTILQGSGNYLVGHTLKNDSQVYGTSQLSSGCWPGSTSRLG